MGKVKKKCHSIADALKYAADLGYEYNEVSPFDLSIGDTVTVGLDRWKVVDVKISGAETSITYKAVGKVRGIDDTYWKNVKATKEEKFKASMEYYKEWKKNADLPYWNDFD